MREDERLIERGRPSHSMVLSCVEKERKKKKKVRSGGKMEEEDGDEEDTTPCT